MHRFQNCLTPEPVHPAVLAFLRARVKSSCEIADKHLADQPFVLGKAPSIVDFSMAGYIYYPATETGFDIATEYPVIDAWGRRLAALPGWKPPYEMMPVGTSPPVRRPRQRQPFSTGRDSCCQTSASSQVLVNPAISVSSAGLFASWMRDLDGSLAALKASPSAGCHL